MDFETQLQQLALDLVVAHTVDSPARCGQSMPPRRALIVAARLDAHAETSISAGRFGGAISAASQVGQRIMLRLMPHETAGFVPSDMWRGRRASAFQDETSDEWSGSYVREC